MYNEVGLVGLVGVNDFTELYGKSICLAEMNPTLSYSEMLILYKNTRSIDALFHRGCGTVLEIL